MLALWKYTTFLFFVLIIAGCQTNEPGTDEDQNNTQEADNREREVKAYYDAEYEFGNEFVQEDNNFAMETNKDRYQEDEEIEVLLRNRGSKDVRIPDAIYIYTFTDGEVQLLEKEIQHVQHYIQPSDSFTPEYAPHDEIRDYFGENSDLSGAYILSMEFEYKTEDQSYSSEKIGKLIYIE